MFVEYTSSEFVVAKEVSEVVLNLPYGVVNAVVPSKELITESHVVVVFARAIENVDEWEFSRFRRADIVLLVEGDTEVVKHLVVQAAVEFSS